VIFGLVLLAAGGLKGYELATEPTAEKYLWTSRWFLIGLVYYQLALGLWLLGGYRPALVRIAALVTFGAFSVFALVLALSGETSCGCFGKVTIDPWLTLGFDLAAVAALLCWRPGAQSKSGVLRARGVFVLSAFLVALVGGTFAARRPGGEGREITDEARVVLLKPEGWVGRPLPLRKYLDIGDELTRGRWVLLLYRHDCRACQEEIPRYARLARSMAEDPGSPRIAFVEVPPRGNAGPLPSVREGPHRLGVLDDAKSWFVETPARIFLEDGVVLSAAEGEAWLQKYH